jgi:hypothetical protein
VPGDLERVILSCLAKEPGDRPESAKVLGRQLAACEDAARWGASEAETWWNAAGSSVSMSTPAAAEQRRVGMFQIDLERRLARLDDLLVAEQESDDADRG